MAGRGEIPVVPLLEVGGEPGQMVMAERGNQVPDPHRPACVMDQAFPTQYGQEEGMRDGRAALGGGDHTE